MNSMDSQYVEANEQEDLIRVKRLLESATGVIVREHMFLSERRNPLIDVELSYTEIQGLIDLLTANGVK